MTVHLPLVASMTKELIHGDGILRCLSTILIARTLRYPIYFIQRRQGRTENVSRISQYALYICNKTIRKNTVKSETEAQGLVFLVRLAGKPHKREKSLLSRGVYQLSRSSEKRNSA